MTDNLPLQVALHNKAEGRELTRTIGHDRIDLGNTVLEEEGLEPGESAAYSKIDFLPGIRCLRHVFIRRCKRMNGFPDVGRNECREVRS